MSAHEFTFATDAAKQYAEEIAKISEQQVILNAGSLFNQEMAKKIKTIWQDEGIKKALELRSQIQLNDSADYYLNDLDRIAKPDYQPNQQDVLRSRVKTVGIVEMEFGVDGRKLKMVDVGGQRNERRKWIHCFDDVTAIIFVTSLSEYDQVLFEDSSVNRMKESLTLFEEICNCRYFRSTSIIIFFNKEDLFKQKIEKVDLKVCFENYTGGCNAKNALEFIQQQFLDSSKKTRTRRQVISKVTCATDTTNITTVFNSVKSIILFDNMRKEGM
jgi:signal recognition particle receptor subunit beta